MIFIVGLLGWAILIAGAIPRPGQQWMEQRVPLWNAQWASIASGVLEAAFGYSLLRTLLVQTGVENAMPAGGVARGIAGAFLAVEGVLRVAIAGFQGTGVASLPILLAWRGVTSIAARAKA